MAGEIDSASAATWALLTDTARAGRGGYGYGSGEGGYGGGFGPWASPSSNAVRIQEGNRAVAAGMENLLDQNQFASTNSNITECCNRTTDIQVNGEFRTSDRLRDVERQIVNARFESKDCCCETQKEIIQTKAALQLENCKNTALLEAKIAAEGTATRELINGNALAAANARVTQLETIQAITQACGCCGGSSSSGN